MNKVSSNQLDIEVRDTVFDPALPRSRAKIHWDKEEDGTTIFEVYLYLSGYDVPYIDSVTYTLHESFDPPYRVVSRTPSNPNCKVAIWTWGLFLVKATIVDAKGFTFTLEHELTYDRELPPAGDAKYVRDEASASLANA